MQQLRDAALPAIVAPSQSRRRPPRRRASIHLTEPTANGDPQRAEPTVVPSSRLRPLELLRRVLAHVDEGHAALGDRLERVEAVVARLATTVEALQDREEQSGELARSVGRLFDERWDRLDEELAAIRSSLVALQVTPAEAEPPAVDRFAEAEPPAVDRFAEAQRRLERISGELALAGRR